MARRVLLLLAVLSLVLTACGGSDDGASSDGGGTAGAGGVTVDIAEFSFKPQTITAAVGATITWTNKDGFAHSVKADGDTFPTSPSLDQGKTYAHTFTKAGTYPYICGIHNSMTGTVIVR